MESEHEATILRANPPKERQRPVLALESESFDHNNSKCDDLAIFQAKAGGSAGYLEVYTPTKIKKKLLPTSMVVIFFCLEAGSRQREGMKPLSALFAVTLYLFSNSGFGIRVPKSMYSSFQILALILSETRVSSGKLDEINSWSGIGCLGPMVSPVRFLWTAVIESCTREPKLRHLQRAGYHWYWPSATTLCQPLW